MAQYQRIGPFTAAPESAVADGRGVATPGSDSDAGVQSADGRGHGQNVHRPPSPAADQSRLSLRWRRQ